MAASGYKRMPALGADPAELCTYINKHVWDGYQAIRRPWLRETEENIRALCGHQYDAYVEPLGEFVDTSSFIQPNDERWRRNPVFNWLGQHWYQLSLAKLTENIPILGALPSTGDAADAATAAIFDPVFRYEWAQMGMPEYLFRAYGWMLASGCFILKLRWDPNRGHQEAFTGPTTLDFAGESRQLSNAPFVRQEDGSFVPGLILDQDGQPAIDPETGEPKMQAPHRQRAGDLDAEVPSPTSVLYPYGPEPYWKKRWVLHEYLLPCDEIEDLYGQQVEPDPLTGEDDLLLKMEYTSSYGMPSSPEGGFGWTLPQAQNLSVEGLVKVRERWERESNRYPHGRLTLVTKTAVLYDDINPFVVEGDREQVVVPIFRFERPGFPFRQEGTSDLEALKPVARARNRALGNMLDASDMAAMPVTLYNDNAITDDQEDQFNVPGGKVKVSGMGLNDVSGAMRHVSPPPMPQAVAEIAGTLQNELAVLGHATVGGQGNAVTNDASGELQREVRFDADRPWGATLRLHSYEWARVGQTMMDILAVCMTDSRVLAIAGDDQAASFVTVRAELFRGRIDIFPQPESAVLETRQDKQNRITQAFTVGAQLAVQDPALADKYFKVLQNPDLQRAMRPGGDAYSLAVRQVADMLLTGIPALVLPEQDHATHILVCNQAMQTATYRDAGLAVQTALRMYRTLHEMAAAQEGLRQAGIQAAVQGEAAQLQVDASAPAAAAQTAQMMKHAPPAAGAQQDSPKRPPGPRRVA